MGMKDFGIFQRSSSNSSSDEKHVPAYTGEEELGHRDSIRNGSISGLKDTTHRGLKARHIQLIGIGGTIGTALYVQIGRGLLNGGPGSLFIAFTLWCFFILAVTVSSKDTLHS